MQLRIYVKFKVVEILSAFTGTAASITILNLTVT